MPSQTFIVVAAAANWLVAWQQCDMLLLCGSDSNPCNRRTVTVSVAVAVAAGICHLLQLGMQHGMLLRLLVAVVVVATAMRVCK